MNKQINKRKMIKTLLISVISILVICIAVLSYSIYTVNNVPKPNFTYLKEFKNINETKASVFIVTTPTCKWCKKLKEDFLEEKYIEQYKNIEFVEIVEGTPVYYALNMFVEVKAFPTIIMLRRDGKGLNFINTTTGYVQPKGLNPAFSFINEGKDIKEANNIKKIQKETEEKIKAMEKEVMEEYNKIKEETK